jgi:hypothetical protein
MTLDDVIYRGQVLRPERVDIYVTQEVNCCCVWRETRLDTVEMIEWFEVHDRDLAIEFAVEEIQKLREKADKA